MLTARASLARPRARVARDDRSRARASLSRVLASRARVVPRAGVSDDDDLTRRRDFDVSSELEADIARYAEAKARETSAEGASSSGAASANESEEAASTMDGIKEAIDTFLLYDFFVILFILSWLIAGVGVRLSKGNGLSYDEPFLGTWLFLWPFLFQPLLGVHMLATLVSPAIGWAKKKNLVSEDTWQ